MKRPGRHLSRPLYESLPWLYVLGGLLALAASYRHESRGWVSALLGLLGFLAVLAGMVVLLRRRDFRDMRSHYLEQGTSLQTPERED
jgi:hypothetical protein